MAKDTTKWIIGIVIIAIVIIGAVLIFTPKETGTIKVGVLTPLTGPAGAYGENILAGIECAKKSINEAGGINGVPIELVVEDSKCDGKEAVTGASKLADVNNIKVIIGQACSAATIPVGNIAQSKDFILIASAASYPKVTESPNVFRVNPNDLAQSKAVAEYIRKDLNKEKVSILALNDEYGSGLVEEFKKRFPELGGKVLKIEWFTPDATDFKTQISKLEDPEIEMLFIIALPAQHPQIAKQLTELGKKWKRIAEFNFGVTPSDAVNPAMKGTIYPITVFDKTITENARFLTNCMQEKGKTTDIVTAWGFDSLYVTAKATEMCPEVTTECIRKHLVGLSFNGASGENSFTEEGEVTRISSEMVEFQ